MLLGLQAAAKKTKKGPTFGEIVKIFKLQHFICFITLLKKKATETVFI